MAVIVYLILAVGLFVSDSVAQMEFHLSFRIYDSEKEPIQGADVKVDPFGITLQSDREGFCGLRLIEPGQFLVHVSADSYASLDTIVETSDYSVSTIEIELVPLSAHLKEIIVYTDPVTRYREFTKDEITESGHTTLESFLYERAGLDILSDGGSGSKISARIGGSNPNQVIVLLDGRRIQSASDGVADLSAIPLEWIETVQIHRGSQTLFGGEGIGGVIDIRTRELSENQEIRAAVDVNEHRQVSTVFRAGKIGELESFISFTRTQGNGEYRYRISEDDGNREFTDQLGDVVRRKNNDVLRDQFFAKAVYAFSTKSRLEFSGVSDRSDRGMPGYLSPRLTPLARQSSGSHFLNTQMTTETGGIDWKVNASLTRSYRHFSDPDLYSLVNESRESDTRYEGALSGKGGIESFDFQGGVRLASEAFSSEQIEDGRASQKRWELWLKADRILIGKAEHSNLKMKAGWRVERVGDAAALGLPRLELVSSFDGFVEGTVAGGWGRSYRSPSFYSLFWQEDHVARGNPDLRPEYSEEWTGYFFLKPHFAKDFEFSGSASTQKVDDLIFWQQTFDGHWKPFNLKNAEIRTLDFQLEYSLMNDHLRLSTGTTWTEARDATDDRNTGGKYLTFRPARTHRASCMIEWLKFHATATYQWVDARPVLVSNSKWLNEYDLLNITVARQFQHGDIGIKPGLRVSNAINESYRIIRHAPMPLREISGTIQLSFAPKEMR